jgi:hypothetical protein
MVHPELLCKSKRGEWSNSFVRTLSRKLMRKKENPMFFNFILNLTNKKAYVKIRSKSLKLLFSILSA